MTTDWHSYRTDRKNWGLDPRSWVSYKFRYNWDVSPAWRLAADQYNYFQRAAYIFKNVVSINSKSEITNVVKNTKHIKKGDLLFFAGSAGNNIHHATIITKVKKKKGKIYYSAHTSSRKDKDLSDAIGNEKVKIIRIKNKAT